MALETVTNTAKTKKAKVRVPKELIYEMRHGSPIYYRDYDKVLSGEKSLEEVMGSSDLHAWFLYVLMKFLIKSLDEKKYIVLVGELGYRFSKRSWYNLDLAVYRREKIGKLKGTFTDVPPEVVIEIDTKADLRKFENPQDYFHRKTQDLLDSGVKKVIWIFTKDRKIWVAQKAKPWLIVDWDYEFEVIEGIRLNFAELLKGEGFQGEVTS
ncbi:Uma2 family endonuclease [Phorcysia thermohydrogeniphila]|uniref:Putative restriction endonuclease n=1 Tax=Phorcysia thermohydrogeniphila TaxID=936138 RepID=A0A4R1GKR5_9BACT|nr:Uma2 family endonuclease [Phorcysia thermohydrogeniphila]TCK06659.1 putative restriction endonuclease [Phorcysia thermohydrogeniphila]